MKGPEKKFEDRLRVCLESFGCTIVKLHGHAAQSGLPDLMVIGPDGVVRFIEVKAMSDRPTMSPGIATPQYLPWLMKFAPHNKLSPKQKGKLLKFAKAGVPCFVVGGYAGDLRGWADDEPWATIAVCRGEHGIFDVMLAGQRIETVCRAFLGSMPRGVRKLESLSVPPQDDPPEMNS